MKSQFKQVYSRITLDAATFTFGILDNEQETFSYKLFCAGSGSHHIDKLAPLNGEPLSSFIQSLKGLNPREPKLKLKANAGSFSYVKFRFSGFDTSKGYKVKATLGGFLFFSSAGFLSSFCSESAVQNLIKNLEKYAIESRGT